MKVTASAFKGRTEPGAKEQEPYCVVHLMTWQRGSWEEEKLDENLMILLAWSFQRVPQHIFSF